MLLKTTTRVIENISKRKLSIQFSLDGFSFCISNFEDTIYHFSQYSFSEEVNTPEIALNRIEEIFQTDKNLQDDFESVEVIHENNLNTLVPNQYFQEDALKQYLDFNVKTLSTDFIVFDDVSRLGLKNVYIPYVNINNFLFQNFGEFDYNHHISVLIDKLIKISSEDKIDVYVNVANERLDMVVFNQGELILSNSFEFETKEDFIYFILFTYEQLKLDTEITALNFLGEIESSSELFQISYKYIKEIRFIENKSDFLKNQDLPVHSNFILLG